MLLREGELAAVISTKSAAAYLHGAGLRRVPNCFACIQAVLQAEGQCSRQAPNLRAKWSVSPSLSTPAVVKAVNPSIAMSNSPLETQAARSGRAACSANARCTPANTQRTPCRLSCSSGRLATRETHSVCRVPIAFS